MLINSFNSGYKGQSSLLSTFTLSICWMSVQWMNCPWMPKSNSGLGKAPGW